MALFPNYFNVFDVYLLKSNLIYFYLSRPLYSLRTSTVNSNVIVLILLLSLSHSDLYSKFNMGCWLCVFFCTLKNGHSLSGTTCKHKVAHF